MKRVENLIENKDLINTFKKSKIKTYLNKSVLKKRSFFFLKFKSIQFKKLTSFFFKKVQLTNIFQKPFLKTSLTANLKTNKHVDLFKSVLMFIKLYLY